MKQIYMEFGLFIVTVISGIVGLYMVMSVLDHQMIVENSVVSADMIVIGVSTDYEPPNVKEMDFKVENAILKKGSVFKWQEYVSVQASDGTDLTKYVVMEGTVDTSVLGKHKVNYILHWNGKTIGKSTTFFVEE